MNVLMAMSTFKVLSFFKEKIYLYWLTVEINRDCIRVKLMYLKQVTLNKQELNCGKKHIFLV